MAEGALAPCRPAQPAAEQTEAPERTRHSNPRFPAPSTPNAARCPAGLERQLALCDSAQPPSWCSDGQLVSQLRTGLDRLWGTIVNNADVAFSEVMGSAGYWQRPRWELSPGQQHKHARANPCCHPVRMLHPSCPALPRPQVWSWKYENGRYRTASLAETSATSTVSNAVQVGGKAAAGLACLYGLLNAGCAPWPWRALRPHPPARSCGATPSLLCPARVVAPCWSCEGRVPD